MFLPALFLISLAYRLTAPIAVLAIVVSLLTRACEGLEIAVVVSRRQRTGSKGQRVVASARLNRASLTRAGSYALSLARSAGETVARSARRAARAADGQADRAGALAICLAVWLSPWVLVEAAAGAGFTVAGYALALAIGGAWIRATRPDVRALARSIDGPPIGR